MAEWRPFSSAIHMSADINIGAILKRNVNFFVDSTLFCAVAPAVITFTTIILTKNLFGLAISFASFFCLCVYLFHKPAY